MTKLIVVDVTYRLVVEFDHPHGDDPTPENVAQMIDESEEGCALCAFNFDQNSVGFDRVKSVRFVRVANDTDSNDVKQRAALEANHAAESARTS